MGSFILQTKNKKKHRARHVEEVRLKRLHCVCFLIFKPGPIRQTYTERRRLAPDFMVSHTHTHQRTQLTIVTNIIEREFVATAILSHLFPRFDNGTALCEITVLKRYD